MASLPKSIKLDSELPRSFLTVTLQERGEYPGDRTVTSVWAFDPAKPNNGLRKIFKGPGQDQSLYFESPLFGGYGLARGQLNPKKEPKSEHSMFWFNAIDGSIGPRVDVDIWGARMDKGWLVGQEIHKNNDKSSLTHIVRYNPLEAVVQTADLGFSYINRINHSEVLGVTKINGKDRIVWYDSRKQEYQNIALCPKEFYNDNHSYHPISILPAGVKCCEGVYIIRGFSLWYSPDGIVWHSVVRDIPIVKTFGGAPAHLPVRYLGGGRFAVSKTIKSEVPVPESMPEDEKMFGAAEAVTMLIDGRSGKLISQSKPFVYNHSPQCNIPETWWNDSMKPKPIEMKEEPTNQSLFQWDEMNKTLKFAGDKKLQLGEEDEHYESRDGRYLLVYQQCPTGAEITKTKVPFRIIDGKTGVIHTAEVESDFYEVWVEPRWHTLTSEIPDSKTLENFNRGLNP